MKKGALKTLQTEAGRGSTDLKPTYEGGWGEKIVSLRLAWAKEQEPVSETKTTNFNTSIQSVGSLMK